MRKLLVLPLLFVVACSSSPKEKEADNSIGLDFIKTQETVDIVQPGESQKVQEKIEEKVSTAKENFKAKTVDAEQSLQNQASKFSMSSVTVRDLSLESKDPGAKLENSTKIFYDQTYLKARDILEFEDMGSTIDRGDFSFKKIKILKARPGLEKYNGMSVYIWQKAF